jgi:hypothetical protein
MTTWRAVNEEGLPIILTAEQLAVVALFEAPLNCRYHDVCGETGLAWARMVAVTNVKGSRDTDDRGRWPLRM